MKKESLGLSGNQLKLLAMLFMTADHVGCVLFPQYGILRIVGRLAMPIFAWMIAEGCYYTKNKARYFFTMLGFGAVCQVVYWFTQQSLYQCILVTFSLSILLIYTMDLAIKKQNILTLFLLGIVFAAICYVTEFMADTLPLPGFEVDYGLIGVLLPVLIYLGRNKTEKLMLSGIGLCALAMQGGMHQWFALLSLPILALYNGKRGRLRMKYLFYFYYPLHLAAIWLIYDLFF